MLHPFRSCSIDSFLISHEDFREGFILSVDFIGFGVYGIGTELHPTRNVPIPEHLSVVFVFQFFLEPSDSGGRGKDDW